MEWQPIETAPKLRDVLVGYRNRAGKWRTSKACFYSPPLHMDAEPFEGCELVGEDEWMCPAAWYEESENECPLCGESWAIALDGSPTHWMPLPEPPDA